MYTDRLHLFTMEVSKKQKDRYESGLIFTAEMQKSPVLLGFFVRQHCININVLIWNNGGKRS